ncbi:uncharacterized protein LOC135201091 [Macrobrachium nipponense]|uniref:uncharacterized protein LOC135201091 n=1 Tax=Macrobrachium nipponense TaxID=159736 RepID=UPI0030C8850E
MKLFVFALLILASAASMVPPLRGAVESVKRAHNDYEVDVSTQSTFTTTDSSNSTDDGITTPEPPAEINGGIIASIVILIMVIALFAGAGTYFMKEESFGCFR